MFDPVYEAGSIAFNNLTEVTVIDSLRGIDVSVNF